MEDLRRGRRIKDELGATATGIAEGISRQLRDCGGNPRLVLAFKSQQLGQSMRPLTYCDDVSLVLDRDRDDWPYFGTRRHDRHHLATRTVASSRCRVRSRYRMAAIRVGCRAARLL